MECILSDIKKTKSKIDLAKELDKYYTKPAIAANCLKLLRLIIDSNNIKNFTYLEPSAGNGSFSKILPFGSIALDIAPENESIIKMDFFSHDVDLMVKDRSIITIGNPPFGKKAKLAVDFLNRALGFSELVAFVVPIQFKKWSVQSKISKDARLIFEEELIEKSFLIDGKDYDLRCCFQVWTKSVNVDCPNIRIAKKPSTSHDDFKLYQYNRTVEAEKFFDYDWDFAVPRQGFYDFSKKVYNKQDCDKKLQWIFFKATSPVVLKNLKMIDFERLSRKNSGIPGFGKADVIEEYNRMFKNE